MSPMESPRNAITSDTSLDITDSARSWACAHKKVETVNPRFLNLNPSRREAAFTCPVMADAWGRRFPQPWAPKLGSVQCTMTLSVAEMRHIESRFSYGRKVPTP
jgi:hypothetical protein